MKKFEIGEKVKIINGAMSGTVCRIIEIQTTWFARVKPMKRIGIVKNIDVPFENIEKVDGGRK